MRPAGPGLLLYRFRTFILLCIGCTAFFLLHNAFGSPKSPPATLSGGLAIPKKIWQSWKVDALRFEQRDAERAMTWTLKNPGHRYECLTDEGALTYVEQHFGPYGINRPDIVSIYKGLNARIIQADLLRYLIMYVEGGIWADIDVEAIRSIDHFIPKRFGHDDIGLVIGVETDEPTLADHPILGSKAQSFCQWTFMARPRLPVMMRLVDNILIWLSRLAAEQKVSISDLKLDFDEVLSGTGPSAFTRAILADMSAQVSRNMTWEDFHDLEESKLVGNTLVLTSEAFAAGTGHSDSGNHGSRGALVKHHFHASSWTTNHPRYKHPIYGEVEKCNCDVECVKLWDANTAFFAALPKEDQMKMIVMKEREDAAEALDMGGAPDLPNDEMPAPPAGFPPTEVPADSSQQVLDAVKAIDGNVAAGEAKQALGLAPVDASTDVVGKVDAVQEASAAAGVQSDDHGKQEVAQDDNEQEKHVETSQDTLLVDKTESGSSSLDEYVGEAPSVDQSTVQQVMGQVES